MNVVVVGFGKMGKLVAQSVERCAGMQVVMIADFSNHHDLNTLQEPIDVIIDFSHPDNQEWLCAYVRKTHTPLVCGTTGLNDLQITRIEELGCVAPVVFAANFSLGITIFQKVLAMMTPILEESFDIEVIEKHHNQKADAPSGTAKLLVETMNENHAYKEVHGRNGMVGKRQKEIGIHAVRGGTLAGEHTVCFYGEDESFEITHTATSKQIFVNGALKAALFLQGKDAGLYTMEDILFY